MTIITGLFKDSGNRPIAQGLLRVRLAAPLSDATTAPDSYLLTSEADFAITNGVLETCDLKESATDQVSYSFSVFATFTDFDYYYAADGSFYARNSERPSHLHTDGRYYTGLVNSSFISKPLDRIARLRTVAIGETFQAIVPNQASVEFAQLERTGFSRDRTPQTARQVAEVLRQNPLFMQDLIDILVITPYSATTLYRRGNSVSIGGSSYQCLIDNTVGVSPPSSSTHWRLQAAKGDPGGTGGNDQAFSSGWNGDLNAPSKNALWDYISANVALQSQLTALAPIDSPNLQNAPTAPTQATGTGASNNPARTRIATCEYAFNEAIDRQRRSMISLLFVASSANPPQFTVRANGQTLSRAAYPELWAIATGTTGYGTGDGSTTFTVPNLANPGTGLYWVVWAGV